MEKIREEYCCEKIFPNPVRISSNIVNACHVRGAIYKEVVVSQEEITLCMKKSKKKMEITK